MNIEESGNRKLNLTKEQKSKLAEYKSFLEYLSESGKIEDNDNELDNLHSFLDYVCSEFEKLNN